MVLEAILFARGVPQRPNKNSVDSPFCYVHYGQDSVLYIYALMLVCIKPDVCEMDINNYVFLLFVFFRSMQI